MPPILLGLVGIICLLILLALRIPIAFALAIIGTVGIVVLEGLQIGIYSLGNYPFGFLKSWLLVAVPLFLFMGYLATSADVTSQAYETAYKWLGKLPGGLAIASVAACAAIAATSGSSVATAGMVGAIAIPEMRKYGYDKKLAAAVTATGGSLGILIPPSIGLVIYGFLAEASVGKLLLAGIFPGILVGLIYSIGIILMVIRKPSLAPKALTFTWKEKFKSLPNIWGVVVLFLTVIGGIYAGVFTPTEAAAAGSCMAFFMCLMKNIRKPSVIFSAFDLTARTTGMILAIVIGASLFTQFLTLSRIPHWISGVISTLDVNRYWILLAILAVYIPLGMFLDTISILLITIPIFISTIISLDFNPIWFGILVVRMEEISLITPPVGLNVYVIKGVVSDITLDDIFIGLIPFLILDFISVGILIAFPEISLWLPSTMIGK